MFFLCCYYIKDKTLSHTHTHTHKICQKILYLNKNWCFSCSGNVWWMHRGNHVITSRGWHSR